MIFTAAAWTGSALLPAVCTDFLLKKCGLCLLPRNSESLMSRICLNIEKICQKCSSIQQATQNLNRMIPFHAIYMNMKPL